MENPSEHCHAVGQRPFEESKPADWLTFTWTTPEAAFELSLVSGLMH